MSIVADLENQLLLEHGDAVLRSAAAVVSAGVEFVLAGRGSEAVFLDRVFALRDVLTFGGVYFAPELLIDRVPELPWEWSPGGGWSGPVDADSAFWPCFKLALAIAIVHGRDRANDRELLGIFRDALFAWAVEVRDPSRGSSGPKL